ncbi:RhoGAP-domain-containing protein [Piedraia hortae CBS 480.64]|uniref:RhoGAP-domain-containing protein n=1 Tax=Piedraia hortae CBS 480.64 TaxID=1314780 RepID=A0A6A7C8N5_9PEZI|nr:RhoGAP-domain-containing protein [Piedraia hortae CBS 480.64]
MAMGDAPRHLLPSPMSDVGEGPARTTSTHSAVSSASGAARPLPDASTPDPAAFIAAAGSADAAVQKLLVERNQAASHNAQLWRLMEKQRAMILGLNRDLEAALRDKERYRQRLKQSIANASANAQPPDSHNPLSPGPSPSPDPANAAIAPFPADLIAPPISPPESGSKAVRKGPPAPLQLSVPPKEGEPSDEEHDPSSAEMAQRGRRRTREDDKREPDGASNPPDERSEQSTAPSQPPSLPLPVQPPPSSLEPAALLRHRAKSDVAGVQRCKTAPSVLSPGLPLSPRPVDKPPNSPKPRAPHKAVTALPGLPQSPRAARAPFPPLAPSTLRRTDVSPNPSGDSESKMSADEGSIYRGLASEQFPDLLLAPNALPSVEIKMSSPRMKPSRQSMVLSKQAEDGLVFTLGVYARSDGRQLWRVEKSVAALAQLDAQVKAACNFKERLPEKALFSGHAPTRIDLRRAAVDRYLDRMLDSLQSDSAARVVCKFLSTDAIGADVPVCGRDADSRPDSPAPRPRLQHEGYLTKRGKNFGGWKARYFVLEGPNLRYYDAPGGAPLGIIRLTKAQIGKQQAPYNGQQEEEDNEFRHAFLVLEPKRKDSSSLVRHVLCAESDEERDAWVEALLQCVVEAEEEPRNQRNLAPVRQEPPSKSPRLQKSLNDLQLPAPPHPDAMRTTNYVDTVPGDAPVHRSAGSPSPPPPETMTQISSPQKGQVIANASDWGVKQSTPQGLSKDKKRSMFAALRGRSSSDLAPGGSPTSPSVERMGSRTLFGAPLADAVSMAQPGDVTTDLPVVVYRCIEFLTIMNATSEEGIFRLSGSNNVIKALRERFNAEGDINLVADAHHYDIHAVASLLKLYLRELPASILTRELHMDFLACLEMSESDKMETMKALIDRLPRPNRALLQILSVFLLSIVNNAEVNKMNVRNVGIVFAPTLNVPAPLISAFVENQEALFGPNDVLFSPSSKNSSISGASGGSGGSSRRGVVSPAPPPETLRPSPAHSAIPTNTAMPSRETKSTWRESGMFFLNGSHQARGKSHLSKLNPGGGGNC